MYRCLWVLVGNVMYYRIRVSYRNPDRWRYKSVWREWAPVLEQRLYIKGEALSLLSTTGYYVEKKKKKDQYSRIVILDFQCLAGRMAMHACQIGPTDTAPPCPGLPLWACVGTKGGMLWGRQPFCRHFSSATQVWGRCDYILPLFRDRSGSWDLRPRS